MADTTAQRARGRARQAAAKEAAELIGGPVILSPKEMALALMQMSAKTWPEIAPHAVHLSDFGGVIQQTSSTANGGLTITVAAPIDYAHAALDAATLGRMGAVFFRAYVVPMDSMAREIGSDGEGGGEDE